MNSLPDDLHLNFARRNDLLEPEAGTVFVSSVGVGHFLSFFFTLSFLGISVAGADCAPKLSYLGTFLRPNEAAGTAPQLIIERVKEDLRAAYLTSPYVDLVFRDSRLLGLRKSQVRIALKFLDQIKLNGGDFFTLQPRDSEPTETRITVIFK